MSSSYSSLDWVLSHWVHFTVNSLDLVVFIWVYVVFFSYCRYVVLLSAQWGAPSGIEAWSLGLLFLQCFDTVGWVFQPIKPVPDMTYNVFGVFGGTLNLAQLNSRDVAMSTNFVANCGKITYPCTYHYFIPKQNGISLPQCAHWRRKWCLYTVWKFREIRSSNARVDSLFVNIRYDMAKKWHN